MKKVFVLAAVLAMAVSAVYAQLETSVPPLINYQGRLTDAEGKGLTGTRKIEFNIYDAATGGIKKWGPQVFQSVPLINGMFNVIIGSTDTEGRLITDAFNAKERYIGVTVDGKAILPRQQVLSAPFAVKAENSAKLDNKTPNWYVPIGSIMAYWGTTAPDGWLLCNGQPVPDGSEYDALRAMVGNNTPNLQGYFLRGLDTSGSVDPEKGRAVGSKQADALLKSHTHPLPGVVKDTGGAYGSPVQYGGGLGITWPGYHGTPTPDSAEANIGDVETRPKNVAVNYIIKY